MAGINPAMTVAYGLLSGSNSPLRRLPIDQQVQRILDRRAFLVGELLQHFGFMRLGGTLHRLDAGAALGGARPEGSAAPDRDRNAGDAVASGAGVGGKTALA